MNTEPELWENLPERDMNLIVYQFDRRSELCQKDRLKSMHKRI